MRQSKRCFEKYDVEVLSLEGTYLRTEARRAVIRDGDETCSVEEYACRHFRRRGYSAVHVENDPIFALFGVLMWPLIQDASDPRRRVVGVFDRRAVDAGMKIVWTHRPSDFGKPEYGVRRAKAIESICRRLSVNRRSCGNYLISGSARAATWGSICAFRRMRTGNPIDCGR
jgi:hypothetical protein